MVWELLGIGLVAVLVLFGSITSSFAEDSLSWKSEYLVGILDSENDESFPVTVTTFSKDSLKLDWEKPEIEKNQKINSYEILRKDLNSNYDKIAEITNPKQLSYIDMNLNEGYYGYKIIPVLLKTDSDKITMHGINREHSFFPIYIQGQQLVAQYLLKQNCLKCFDESFEEIDDIFQYEFSENNKRTNDKYQQNLDSESLRTKTLFDFLFKIRNNH
ncbi:MAG: fibronectin type III domain-containing protein [Nitrosopumilus sp.]|nr:fibronectin type III domain-containing protein [Nitrosopumilus sp.]NNL53021.1 fibronectin type III domain-containing protein [Nitrosopumilus sp.]